MITIWKLIVLIVVFGQLKTNLWLTRLPWKTSRSDKISYNFYDYLCYNLGSDKNCTANRDGGNILLGKDINFDVTYHVAWQQVSFIFFSFSNNKIN